MTGTAVNRSKKDVCWSNSGINLGFLVLPWTKAIIAITEHIATKITARRTDTAELNLNDSVKDAKTHLTEYEKYQQKHVVLCFKVLPYTKLK